MVNTRESQWNVTRLSYHKYSQCLQWHIPSSMKWRLMDLVHDLKAIDKMHWGFLLLHKAGRLVSRGFLYYVKNIEITCCDYLSTPYLIILRHLCDILSTIKFSLNIDCDAGPDSPSIHQHSPSIHPIFTQIHPAFTQHLPSIHPAFTQRLLSIGSASRAFWLCAIMSRILVYYTLKKNSSNCWLVK